MPKWHYWLSGAEAALGLSHERAIGSLGRPAQQKHPREKEQHDTEAQPD